MNLFKGLLRNGSLNRVQSVLVVGLGCFASTKGSAQLIYLTDVRSVSGSASVNNVSQYNSAPYYTTSYSGNFSGSASPSSLFSGDFQGNISGSAIFQGGLNLAGGQSPMTISSTVMASQNSFLHPGELYFSSFESSFGSPNSFGQPSSKWFAEGSSSLQVSFQVLNPVAFNFLLQGTGDPFASSDAFSLGSSGQGVLFGGDTASMLQHNQYGTQLDYSGTFTPGNTYTLNLQSQGSLDGGGLIGDLTVADPLTFVPEPSITAFAGLAFVIFLLRLHRIGQPTMTAVPVKVRNHRGNSPRR
jgi:hypothetical protein